MTSATTALTIILVLIMIPVMSAVISASSYFGKIWAIKMLYKAKKGGNN